MIKLMYLVSFMQVNYKDALRSTIVDVRIAYIRKLAILGNRELMATANYSPVLCSYIWGPLDLNP